MTTPTYVADSLLDPQSKKVLAVLHADLSASTQTGTLHATVLADLTALRNAVVAMNAKLDVLTAKLNADAGVTDINYATNFASTLNPAALTTT